MIGKEEYWGMSLDDIAEQIWDIQSDAVGAHYLAFEGTKDVARTKMIEAFTAFIDKHMYRATAYGSPWKEGDDDNDD